MQLRVIIIVIIIVVVIIISIIISIILQFLGKEFVNCFYYLLLSYLCLASFMSMLQSLCFFILSPSIYMLLPSSFCSSIFFKVNTSLK